MCTLGLGAILCQNQNGVDCIIDYANRSLSKAEPKYLTDKQELLALTFAIMEEFHEYVYDNNFMVYVDNNLLT